MTNCRKIPPDDEVDQIHVQQHGRLLGVEMSPHESRLDPGGSRKRNVLRSKISAEELPSAIAHVITDSGSAYGDGALSTRTWPSSMTRAVSRCLCGNRTWIELTDAGVDFADLEAFHGFDTYGRGGCSGHHDVRSRRPTIQSPVPTLIAKTVNRIRCVWTP